MLVVTLVTIVLAMLVVVVVTVIAVVFALIGVAIVRHLEPVTGGLTLYADKQSLRLMPGKLNAHGDTSTMA